MVNIESLPIINYLEKDLLGLVIENKGYLAGIGMADDVGDSFLSDPER